MRARSASRSKYCLLTRGGYTYCPWPSHRLCAELVCCPHFVAVTDVQDCQRTTCVAKTYSMEDLLRWKRWYVLQAIVLIVIQQNVLVAYYNFSTLAIKFYHFLLILFSAGAWLAVGSTRVRVHQPERPELVPRLYGTYGLLPRYSCIIDTIPHGTVP